MQCVCMPQVLIAVGFDSANNPIDLYTGQDCAAAEAAVDAAGTAGTIIEGYATEEDHAWAAGLPKGMESNWIKTIEKHHSHWALAIYARRGQIAAAEVLHDFS